MPDSIQSSTASRSYSSAWKLCVLTCLAMVLLSLIPQLCYERPALSRSRNIIRIMPRAIHRKIWPFRNLPGHRLSRLAIPQAISTGRSVPAVFRLSITGLASTNNSEQTKFPSVNDIGRFHFVGADFFLLIFMDNSSSVASLHWRLVAFVPAFRASEDIGRADGDWSNGSCRTRAIHALAFAASQSRG